MLKFKVRQNFVLIIIALLVFYGCSQNPANSKKVPILKDLSAVEAHQLIEENEWNENFSIIDALCA